RSARQQPASLKLLNEVGSNWHQQTSHFQGRHKSTPHRRLQLRQRGWKYTRKANPPPNPSCLRPTGSAKTAENAPPASRSPIPAAPANTYNRVALRRRRFWPTRSKNAQPVPGHGTGPAGSPGAEMARVVWDVGEKSCQFIHRRPPRASSHHPTGAAVCSPGRSPWTLLHRIHLHDQKQLSPRLIFRRRLQRHSAHENLLTQRQANGGVEFLLNKIHRLHRRSGVNGRAGLRGWIAESGEVQLPLRLARFDHHARQVNNRTVGGNQLRFQLDGHTAHSIANRRLISNRILCDDRRHIADIAL